MVEETNKREPRSRIAQIFFLSAFLVILFFGDDIFKSARTSHGLSTLATAFGHNSCPPLIRNDTEICACGKNGTTLLGLRSLKDKMGVQLMKICCATDSELEHMWRALQSIDSFDLTIRSCQLEDGLKLRNFSRSLSAGLDFGKMYRPRIGSNALRFAPAFASTLSDTTLKISKYELCFALFPLDYVAPGTRLRRRAAAAAAAKERILTPDIKLKYDSVNALPPLNNKKKVSVTPAASSSGMSTLPFCSLL